MKAAPAHNFGCVVDDGNAKLIVSAGRLDSAVIQNDL